jgi:hypothetical protein
MPTLRTPLKLALIGTFALVFLLGYFVRWPIPGFLNIAGSLILAGFTGLAALGWGSWPLDFIWPQKDHRTRAEQVLFSLALGWGVLSFLMMLLGLVHLWIPIGARLLIAGGIGLGLWRICHYSWGAGEIPGDEKRWLWLFIPVGFISLLLALTPPTYYDALVYHLALPSAYIRAGHWIGWQDLVYSAFPQNLEMLWTLGLLTGVPALPNLISWIMAAMLLVAVDRWSRRFLDAATGSAAAVFLLAMPAFLLLSSGGYVDVGLALYAFLSLYALSLRTPEHEQGPSLLAGVFAGFAIGIKYTGGIGFLLGLVWILTDRSRAQKMKSALLYTGAAFIVFLPWLIKNWIYMGNPVFPFFYTWGRQAMNPWMQGAAQGYFRALVEYHPHSVWELPRLLWSIAVQGIQFGGGIDILGDFGWAPLVLFLPAIALTAKRPTILKKAGLYALLFFSIWGMTRPVLRFLLPLAPLLAVLAAYGWTTLERKNREYRWVARGTLGLLGLSSLFTFFQITDVFQPFRVPLGLQSRAEYLTEKLNYYGAASFINENSDPKASVLVVGDQRSYYYERHVLAWTVFNRNPIIDWTDNAADALALRETLRQHATLMVVNHVEMKRLEPYHALDFSARGQSNWDALLKMLTPVYRDNSCEVYTL